MKIFIWFMCIFVASVIKVGLEHIGVMLGAIPMIILYSICFWSAKALCKKWDNRKGNQIEFYYDEDGNLVKKDDENDDLNKE